MNEITQEQLEDLIQNLMYTDTGVFSMADRLGFDAEDLTDEQWEYLDGEIFQCERCSYWCPMGDLSLEGSNSSYSICRDCACDPDEDGEEEED